MADLSIPIAFVAGLSSIISPPALGFLAITIGLPIFGLKRKKNILMYISLGITFVVFVISFQTTLFVMGPILASIIENGDSVLLFFYNLGIILPSLAVIIACLTRSYQNS